MYSDRKAAQVAAFFLLKSPNKRLEIVKLMKLLYLAERESIKRYHSPLLWDCMVSMPHGPVLSQTLDYINGHLESSPDGWEDWISDRENHEVSLKKDITEDDLTALSQADIELLNDIWQRFGHMSSWELRKWTHKNCHEWEDPKGSAFPIPYERLLKVLGFDQDTSKNIIQHIEEMRFIDDIFKQL